MATKTYDDARAVADAATDAPFVLPTYSGGQYDLSYLKTYVLGLVTSIYDVSANVFDDATIYSTSILRDFVHRALEQNVNSLDIDDITAQGLLQYPQTEDVATGFRYPAWGVCGFMAWQEYQVFRAFGYDTNLIATINGPIDSYTDSHVLAEVKLDDTGQYIVQDSTFNTVLTDHDGDYLSYSQAIALNTAGETVNFDNFDVYTYYRSAGNPIYDTEPSFVTDEYYDNYFKGPYYYWGSDGTTHLGTYKLFPDFTEAHDPSSYQGDTFSSVNAALAAIDAAGNTGANWAGISSILRANGDYASGFVFSDDHGNPTSHFITVRLDDGSYVSIDYIHGVILNGSYDQLIDEATNGSTHLNPGVDLSAFLGPTTILDYDGSLGNNWLADENLAVSLPTTHDVLLQSSTGAITVWDIANGTIDTALTFAPAAGSDVIGHGDFNGDGDLSALVLNSTTHALALADTNGIHGLGGISSAWSVLSDSPDLTGDGSNDIVLRNTTTGEFGFWDISNDHIQSYTKIGAVTPVWQVAAVGDFNGDGTDDFIWRNTSTGATSEWLMNNGTIAVNKSIGGLSAAWQIAGTGDFNTDGTDDILWQNSNTGQYFIWDMHNGSQVNNHALATLDLTWQVAEVADLTKEGTDDIVWQNTSTGQVRAWVMDHYDWTVASIDNQDAGTVNSGWHIV